MSPFLKMRKLTALALLALAALPAAAGAACRGDIARTAPDSRFSDNADGTVTDLDTDLIWKRCSEGQTYNAVSGGCDGTGAKYNWQQALQRVEAVNTDAAGESLGQTDWRLPNIKELVSLVERACNQPAINQTAFPATTSEPYWSASISASEPSRAWYVDFDEGYAGRGYKHDEESYRVQLVRGGQ